MRACNFVFRQPRRPCPGGWQTHVLTAYALPALDHREVPVAQGESSDPESAIRRHLEQPMRLVELLK